MVYPISRGLQNLTLAVFSVFVALLIFELVSRFIIEPVNFLRPELVDDSVLGHIIRPETGGHDTWGFRNRSVPASAKIVTIGDSQTYGASVAAKDSWPSMLNETSKQAVYSLSLGGYGPVQYFHLLTTKAVKLSPEVVVVGFYLGNDLLEAYEMVRNNPHWAWLKRAGDPPPLDNSLNGTAGISPAEPPAALFSDLRTWLARRSIVYNMLIYSVIGELARVIEALFVARQEGGEGNVRYDKNGIYSGFTPDIRLRALDLKDPRVKEGLRITLELFGRMQAYCVEHAIRFLVALIPTKESVYASYLEKDPEFDKTALKSLLANERTVNAAIKAFFEDRGIAYINLLPQMQEQVARMQLYPGNFDGHPNKNGNRVIAAMVERSLPKLAPKPLGRSSINHSPEAFLPVR